MLAVKAPGAHVDIAPSWMIDEASKLARIEHYRAQRGRGHGRGVSAADGRGRGSETKGDGGKDDSSFAPTQGPRGRGRGSKVK